MIDEGREKTLCRDLVEVSMSQVSAMRCAPKRLRASPPGAPFISDKGSLLHAYTGSRFNAD